MHTATGVFFPKRNLIIEAMNAGIQPSTTMIVSSTTTTSTSTTKTSMPTPTPTKPGGESGSGVVAFPILV